MLFSTPFFLFVFLPVFFALYWLVPRRRALLLLGGSVFYAWSEPRFLLVVYASAVFDWVLGRSLSALEPARRHGPAGRALVTLGVAGNLGLLLYVKYTAFGVATLNALLASWQVAPFAIPSVLLPLGVSFIVFEKITYLVDLYRGVARPAASLLDYVNYVLLFPKLLAGPIVKYHDIAPQLARPSHTFDDLREGLVRFVQGLAKKTIIADALAPTADRIFSLPLAELDSRSAWLGLGCFTLQIYFDFSGYSDMAIGLARVLGFRLQENFNDPYLATSFTDFWRRWHISLSTWIKEYLYIPLGGSRVSTARGYANLCVCFVLSGLWHGASWNFVLWGCAHGVALVADRAFWLQAQRALPRAFNVALTFFLVMLTWVLFRCPEFSRALGYLRALFGWTSAPWGRTEPLAADVLCVLGLGFVLVLAPVVRRWLDPGRFFPPAACRLGTLAWCYGLLALSVARISVSTFHPFLYFRF